MFKWFKKESDIKSLEKELASIATRINKAEAKISYYRTTSRRIIGALTLYGILIYAVYLAIWILFYMRQMRDSRHWIIHFLPVLVGPALIHLLRRMVTAVYGRRLKTEQSTLELCRSEQKEKIEVFKRKTDFYSTKSLIDRYSGESSESAQTTPSKKDAIASSHAAQSRHDSPRLATQAQLTPNFGTPQSLKGTIATPASLSGLPKHPSQDSPITAEFAPNADARRPSSHWYDRILDVVIGEDEANEHSRFQLEKKLRERDERIAALELELLKTRPMATSSSDELPAAETEIENVRGHSQLSGTSSVDRTDGSTGIYQEAKRSLRTRKPPAPQEEPI